jgi:hypothetical protein
VVAIASVGDDVVVSMVQGRSAGDLIRLDVVSEHDQAEETVDVYGKSGAGY